jgi:hypothetical protein
VLNVTITNRFCGLLRIDRTFDLGCGCEDWIWLAQDRDRCECGEEHSGSIIRGEFLD